jgi:hypothetical protein
MSRKRLISLAKSRIPRVFFAICLLFGASPASLFGEDTCAGVFPDFMCCFAIGFGCAIHGYTCQDDVLACMERLPPAPPPPPPSAPARNSFCAAPAALRPYPRLPSYRPSAASFARTASTGPSQACDITAFDPVQGLLAGNGIVANSDLLETLIELQGRMVSAIAADSAARVVLRIGANNFGETLQLTLEADGDDGEGLGRLSLLNATQRTTTLNVTAQRVHGHPVAFAVFYAPSDYTRGSKAYDITKSRQVTIRAKSLDNPDFSTATTIAIVRPPLVLVHGLWSDKRTWATSTLITDKRFDVHYVDYDQSVHITSIVPFVLPDLFHGARRSSLGFDFNAPGVLAQNSGRYTGFQRQWERGPICRSPSRCCGSQYGWCDFANFGRAGRIQKRDI